MLIILHPYKFTEFHYLSYGLDFYEKKLCTKIQKSNEPFIPPQNDENL